MSVAATPPIVTDTGSINWGRTLVDVIRPSVPCGVVWPPPPPNRLMIVPFAAGFAAVLTLWS
jgi:hypothetical protein